MPDSPLTRLVASARSRVFGRRDPAPPASGRRRFFLQAGVAGAAIGGSLLLSDEAWAAVETRASQFGITPGTTVDAQGRPVESRDVDPYLGEIMLVGYNFATRGFALCQGQLLPINSNQSLYSLLGTIYGGDGRTSFALPDLRSRIPMGMGNGAGLSPRQIGQKTGSEEVFIQTSNLPAHNHSIPASTGAGTSRSPAGNVLAGTPGEISFAAPPATTQMQPTLNTGSNLSIQKTSPILGLNFQIALQGTFPSRD